MSSSQPLNEFKQFHIGDIISITSGIMVSPRKIEGVYDILGWMTGEQLFTHQLIRASGQCEPVLKELYPAIAAIKMPNFDHLPENDRRNAWITWLGQQVDLFGETLPVPKLTVHTPVDPIQELVDMTSEQQKIIVVVADSKDG